jgi:protein-S-isoprenylcysteine O-methyltransferase Ste14
VNPIAFRLLVALVVFGHFAHRMYYYRKVRHAADSVVRQPRDPAAAIFGFLVLPAYVLTAFYLAWPAVLGWASMRLPLWLRWAGVVPAVTGFAVLHWAQSALGTSWSIQPLLLENQRMVAAGPYRWVRHPMYAGVLLAHASLFLLSANWCVGVLWLGTSAWQFAARMPIEEALMMDRFGEAYRAYARARGRLLPRVLHRGSGT